MNRSLSITYLIVLASASTAFGRTAGVPKEAETKATLAQLRQTLEAYYGVYHTLPTGDDKTIMAILTATNADGQNPRKMIFFEFRQPEKWFGMWTTKPGDRAPDGTLTDSWGRSLVWSIDRNKPSVTIRSLGPNGKDDGGQSDDIDITYSPK